MTDVVTLLYSTAYSIIFPLDYLAQTNHTFSGIAPKPYHICRQAIKGTNVCAFFISFFFFEEEKELILNL